MFSNFSWTSSLINGVNAGLIVALGWRLFFYLYPCKLPLWCSAFSSLLFSNYKHWRLSNKSYRNINIGTRFYKIQTSCIENWLSDLVILCYLKLNCTLSNTCQCNSPATGSQLHNKLLECNRSLLTLTGCQLHTISLAYNRLLVSAVALEITCIISITCQCNWPSTGRRLLFISFVCSLPQRDILHYLCRWVISPSFNSILIMFNQRNFVVLPSCYIASTLVATTTNYFYYNVPPKYIIFITLPKL